MSLSMTFLRAAVLAGCATASMITPLTPASATTATTTFAVSLTVVASCTVSATALTIASVSMLTANTYGGTGTATVTPTCTNGTPYYIQLNGGANAGVASSADGRLALGADNSTTLAYGLYTDNAYANNWDNSSSSGNTVATGTGTGAAAAAITVYAKVPLTSKKAQVYSDTITVTINY